MTPSSNTAIVERNEEVHRLAGKLKFGHVHDSAKIPDTFRY